MSSCHVDGLDQGACISDESEVTGVEHARQERQVRVQAEAFAGLLGAAREVELVQHLATM